MILLQILGLTLVVIGLVMFLYSMAVANTAEKWVSGPVGRNPFDGNWIVTFCYRSNEKDDSNLIFAKSGGGVSIFMKMVVQ
jgi:hypothetical protein